MRKLFSLFLALVATTSLWAYDFQSGDLYYKITSSSAPYTVEVIDAEWSITFPIIPETVTYNGITYSVTSIGNHAFRECTSLTSVTIPNSVTSIGYKAFYECTSLTSVTIGNSVTSIGDEAFALCFSITSVTIGNSVTSIGEWAFIGCSSLTSIIIPNSVTSIGDDAFYGCSSLTSPVYNAHCFAYMPTSFEGTYTVPDGIKQIAGGAFSNCSSLTSITIPNSVTSIGNSAFFYCTSLTSIIIPNSVTSIGGYAFSGCSSLTSIAIPNSVTSIGDRAFYGCSSLTSVTIPNSVTSIGSYAFAYCSSLTSVTIPNSVTSIGYGAFAYCSSLTSIIIPNSVTSIGDYAFSGCSSLTSVTIPNSVTSIGDYAFAGCDSLTSITCEATTPPTLGSNVFYGVSTSIPVYVPCRSENVYKAASGWKEFTNIQEPQVEYAIQVSTSNSQMGSAIVVYNTSCDGAKVSATANDYYHFVQWSDGNTDNPRVLELTQDTVLTAEFALTIAGQCGDNLYWSYDETAKTISITGSGEMYDYTASTQPWLLFKEEIKEVIIANTATSIGTSAFEGCIRLGKISLGTGLKNIAADAFAGCTRLYDIYVYATYPPFADESSFANYNVYLYVPCENQRDYILDIVWGKFKFIECLESEETTTDGNVTVVPGTNDVTITWPTEENADTYSIVIKKDGEVFCTLTFNAEGQLLNIAFAPGRDGNHPAQYAQQAGKGYRFTVTSLESGTKYGYNIDVKDASNKTIKSHSGEFTTQSTTAVDNITTNNANIQKIMRDGQLIILRDGVEYNAIGQEL